MDKAVVKPVVCFGEILWDLLPDKELPGGAPMNVAFHLNKLGIQPTLFTRVGEDERGKTLIRLLQEQQLDTKFVQVDKQVPTGIVHAVSNERGEMSYDIVFPSAWDFTELDASNGATVEASRYFIFGSLIARNKQSRDTLFSLLELAPTKVLDINLRPPNFEKALINDLLQKASIVKMNIHELNLIAGWLSSFTSTQDQMQVVQEHFQIAVLIVTKGDEGAIVNYQGKWYEHPGYKVTVADTIGSGDAFLAGFLQQIEQGNSPEEALAFACGLGALVASKSGGWPVYEVEEVYELMKNR